MTVLERTNMVTHDGGPNRIKMIGTLVMEELTFFEHCSKVFEMQKGGSVKGSSISYVHKTFRKTKNFYPLIRTRWCAYKEVTSVSFSEHFAYALNG